MKREKRNRMSVIWKNNYASLSEPKPLFTVLVAAAGSGQRMGGIYKPLSLLGGRPMIAYVLEAFEKSGFVKQMVVSAPCEQHDAIWATAKQYGFTKLRHIVSGGATRAESVICAFRAAFPDKTAVTPFLAVHDAARPLITEKQINDVFFACVRFGSAVAATKVRDAVKYAGNDCVITQEIDRSGLWQIQTPQAFDTDIFHTSLVSVPKEQAAKAVDDGALVMQAGFRVMCVETGFANFKVTYPEDLAMAEAILAARSKASEQTPSGKEQL